MKKDSGNHKSQEQTFLYSLYYTGGGFYKVMSFCNLRAYCPPCNTVHQPLFCDFKTSKMAQNNG